MTGLRIFWLGDNSEDLYFRISIFGGCIPSIAVAYFLAGSTISGLPVTLDFQIWEFHANVSTTTVTKARKYNESFSHRLDRQHRFNILHAFAVLFVPKHKSTPKYWAIMNFFMMSFAQLTLSYSERVFRLLPEVSSRVIATPSFGEALCTFSLNK